jgi:hypothetical protein
MSKWVLSSVGMVDQFLEDIRESVKAGLEDGPVTIVVERKKETRSEQQHRLYRVWCRHLAENSGQYMDVWDDEFSCNAKQRMDEDAWHDMLRYAYLPSRSAEVQGRSLTILTSTTKLTVQQMNEYLHKIEALASRMGIRLPIPGDCEAYIEYRDAA